MREDNILQTATAELNEKKVPHSASPSCVTTLQQCCSKRYNALSLCEA